MTDRPKKIKIEGESHVTSTSVTTTGTSEPVSPSSAPRNKAPNVLDMLKASQQQSVHDKKTSSLMTYKLVNTAGDTCFSISRPGAPSFDCV